MHDAGQEILRAQFHNFSHGSIRVKKDEEKMLEVVWSCAEKTYTCTGIQNEVQ
jgi:hypothetical protein